MVAESSAKLNAMKMRNWFVLMLLLGGLVACGSEETALETAVSDLATQNAALATQNALLAASMTPQGTAVAAPFTPSPTARPTFTPPSLTPGTAAAAPTPTVTAVARVCSPPWFFEPAPERCPAAPAERTFAAEQKFENGRMLWVASQGRIYVLYDDGDTPGWQSFADTWTDGEPEFDRDLVPPEGRFQPVRGFGKLWRENTAVAARLGWAIEREGGYAAMLSQRNMSLPWVRPCSTCKPSTATWRACVNMT